MHFVLNTCNGWLLLLQLYVNSVIVPCALTPSLPRCHLKTINKIGKFESLRNRSPTPTPTDPPPPLPSRYPHPTRLFCTERIFNKTHSTDSRRYRTGKYTVCRRVHVSFNPETLQAVAVKGLILSSILILADFNF